MSLYRKYRPKNFQDLVGQEHVSITLSNALKLNRVHHSYLFTGPRGTGKTSSARILAKALNCLQLENANPCERCEICTDINDGRLIDVIEIDAASNRGIDEMRDLREKIYFASTRAKNKVYIIDEVHMLTKEAFNALLKTLEEPPPRVFFILATTEVHKVPETIISRCQRFDFKRIEDGILIDRLQAIAKSENISVEPKALEVISQQAQGGLRDAIGLMEQLMTDNMITFEHACDILGLSTYARMENLYQCLQLHDTKAALGEIHSLYAEGYDLIQFNKSFLEFIRKKLLSSIENKTQSETLRLLDIVQFFQESHEQSRFAIIVQLPLEIAVIQACLQKNIESETSIKPNTEVVSIPHQKLESKTGKKSEPENVPVSSSIKTVSVSSGYTIDDIRKNWSHILESLQLPVIKRSLQQAVISEMREHDLILTFSSRFHFEKIQEALNRHEAERALQSFFKIQLKIIPEFTPLPSLQASHDMVDKVAEFFDGEIVEG